MTPPASGGPISFNSERNGGKNAAKTNGFGFPRRGASFSPLLLFPTRLRRIFGFSSVQRAVRRPLSATASLPLPGATVGPCVLPFSALSPKHHNKGQVIPAPYCGIYCLTCSGRRHRLPCNRRRSTAGRRCPRRRRADRPCWGRSGAPAADTTSRSSCRTAGSAPRWPP